LFDFSDLNIVSFEETLLRILLAVFFGLILGVERDSKNKPIDFRAYMIVASTTCIIAIMGQELYHGYALKTNDAINLDLGKIISGVLTGIGFLGAGAIIKVENNEVRGTATGASIWAAGGIGLCLGFGMYTLAGIAFAAIASILIIGGPLGKRLHNDND
jgi:putative Mg2+ transporter-C (MgtC) family protein